MIIYKISLFYFRVFCSFLKKKSDELDEQLKFNIKGISLRKLKRTPLMSLTILGLVSCSSQELKLKIDPLTGQNYYLLRVSLIPLKNSEKADLRIKCYETPLTPNSQFKAVLYLTQIGKNYAIDPAEKLILIIDGHPYPLDVINSYNQPNDDVSFTPISCGNRSSFWIGNIKEVTKRKISFYLPTTYLSRMANAKSIFLEINTSAKEDSENFREYPILLELSRENVSFIQSLKEIY